PRSTVGLSSLRFFAYFFHVYFAPCTAKWSNCLRSARFAGRTLRDPHEAEAGIEPPGVPQEVCRGCDARGRNAWTPCLFDRTGKNQGGERARTAASRSGS